MRVEDVKTVMDMALSELPPHILAALEHVELVIAHDHNDELLAEVVIDEEGHTLPPDFRGFYEGTVVDGGDDDEDEAALPIGRLYLNAAMLENSDDVYATLYHEIGHALGLDESEVEELGLE